MRAPARINAEKSQRAQNDYAWLLAYRKAGFRRREAMQMLVASIGRLDTADLAELLTKGSALIERRLAESA